MLLQQERRSLGCVSCSEGTGLDFDFTMAFQPIVNATTRSIYGHEALVRGTNREGAGEIFKHVNEGNRYKFDQGCRRTAIELAARLGNTEFLSINFLPNAVYRPELCIKTTLKAAERSGFPIGRIIFEFTEGEKVTDIKHLRGIVDYYQEQGFKTALDDFGAGYAGLSLLAEIQTDIVKIDMELIRGVEASRPRQAIVKSIVRMCADLNIDVIAEGIETYEELTALRSFGIELFQGYYYAKPAFEALAEVAPTAFDAPRRDRSFAK